MAVNSKANDVPAEGSIASALVMPGLLPGLTRPAPEITALTLPEPPKTAPELTVRPEVADNEALTSSVPADTVVAPERSLAAPSVSVPVPALTSAEPVPSPPKNEPSDTSLPLVSKVAVAPGTNDSLPPTVRSWVVPVFHRRVPPFIKIDDAPAVPVVLTSAWSEKARTPLVTVTVPRLIASVFAVVVFSALVTLKTPPLAVSVTGAAPAWADTVCLPIKPASVRLPEPCFSSETSR